MFGKSGAKHSIRFDWAGAIPVFRYAIGSTLILAVATGSNYTLSFVTPVLALGFLAPGAKPLTIKDGVGFVLTLSAASIIAITFGRVFLDFPFVFIALLGLALLQLYYTNTLNPLFKVWLIISLLLIPLLSTISHKLGATVAISLVLNGIMAVSLVWFIYQVFYQHQSPQAAQQAATAAPVTDRQRFQTALKSFIVIFPVVVAYFAFQWSGTILVMIFVVLLSMNPAAANFKSGNLMILANVAGGIAAIVAFNLFTVVPQFIFLILITLLMGFYFGSRVFSGKPTAPLYGTAFSTYLLVLGSVTTSSEGDAGEKVWTRIIQIGAAVTYVVIAFGVLNHFIEAKKKT